MRTGLIVCGALGREVKNIVRKHRWNASILGVPPLNHMYPLRIAPDVERRILKLRADCDNIAVVYGECGTRGTLDEVLNRYGAKRIDAQNCYEMYAGEMYQELLEEERGTFFLTDFLVRTFHRAVIEGLGLDRFPELKTDYFHNCRRIVYLVQRRDPELLRRAESISEYIDVPLQVYDTGLKNLEDRLTDLFSRLRLGSTENRQRILSF
ncbi:MAG: DUF1638 domain-containing protein [Dehalococcoidia bacterium]